jgi:chemotaxis protein CheZ
MDIAVDQSYDSAVDRKLAGILSEMRAMHLESAVDQLNEIVRVTEDATNSILEAAEKIEEGGMIADSVEKIYQACSFQDITGQRIGKMVAALKHLEDRLDHIAQTFGHETSETAKSAMPDHKAAGDDDLLNGPQMPEAANNQADIDALLASFD